MAADVPEDVIIIILAFVPVEDLLESCRRVCKRWKQVIDQQSVWRIKCTSTGRFVEGKMGSPPNDFRTFYFLNPYRRNLIKNPCGESQYKYSSSCFATSYDWFRKQQVIDLLKAGCSPQVLDEIRPEIEVFEWTAARFDCGSIFTLKVQLLSEDKKVIDEFNISHQEPQWQGKEWKKICHTFTGYGPGVRYILFQDAGKDTQFWAGNYGSKMSAATVTFCF